MKIWAWIPAREGSKGIPHKNRKEIHGKPLWEWSCIYASSFPQISKIILSTNDPVIQQQALKLSSNYPKLYIHKRSEENSQDLSRDFEVLQEIRTYILKEESIKLPDWWIQLRPTYPFRPRKTLETILHNTEILEWDAFRTVIPVDHPPLKMYQIDVNKKMKPLCYSWNNIQEPFDAPRQELGQFYWHNGCIDGISDKAFIEEQTLLPTNTFAILMNKEDNLDIDIKEDWEHAELVKNFA